MKRKQPNPLAIRLPQSLQAQIEAYCAEIGCTRHGFCVDAIEFFFRQHKAVHAQDQSPRLHEPKQAKTPAA